MNYSLFLSELSNKELRMYDHLKRSEKITTSISIIQELQCTQLSHSHLPSPQHHYQLGSICKTALALTCKAVSALDSAMWDYATDQSIFSIS